MPLHRLLSLSFILFCIQLLVPITALAADKIEFIQDPNNLSGTILVIDAEPGSASNYWEILKVTSNKVSIVANQGISYDGAVPTGTNYGTTYLPPRPEPAPSYGDCSTTDTPPNVLKWDCGTTAPYLLTGIRVYAGDGDDIINASVDQSSAISVPVEIYGEKGNDYLIGGSSTDTLYGGDGDDYLRGSCGADNYFGGLGSDTVTYYQDAISCPAHVTNGVSVSLDGVANDTDGDNAGDPETYSIEHIHGTDGPDILVGGSGWTMIYANGGNDTINVQDSASDTVDCGDGSDTIKVDETGDTVTNCETIEKPAKPEPPFVIKPPVKYTAPTTAGCPTSQKQKEVAGVLFCFNKETKKSATTYELSGDVTSEDSFLSPLPHRF